MSYKPPSGTSSCRQGRTEERSKEYSSPIQQRKSKSRYQRCGSLAIGIQRLARQLPGNIEINNKTFKEDDLTQTINPIDLTVPEVQIPSQYSTHPSSPGATFDTIFNDALDSVLMGIESSSLDASDQSDTTYEDIQIQDMTQVFPESFEEPYFYGNESTGSFDMAQFEPYSSTRLSPASSSNFSDAQDSDDFFELDEMMTSELDFFGSFGLDSSDTGSPSIWLDRTSYFAGLANAEQETTPASVPTIQSEKRTRGENGDDFKFELNYVLGGIGGEVPLIQ